MVGPSFTEEDRRTATRRLKLGFVGLVGLSGGLVSLAVGATLVQTLVALAVGCLVGWALVAYLGRVGREWQQNR